MNSSAYLYAHYECAYLFRRNSGMDDVEEKGPWNKFSLAASPHYFDMSL